MYYCKTCGQYVEGEWIKEAANEANCGLPGAGYTFYRELRCEECGSDDLVEAQECPTCGSWMTSEHGEDFCEECMSTARSAVMRWAEDQRGNVLGWVRALGAAAASIEERF